MSWFGDDNSEQVIRTLQNQVAEQQATIDSLRDTLSAGTLGQSRFFPTILNGPVGELVDMGIVFVLAIGFTYLAMYVMTKFFFIQDVNVPYHDDFDRIVKTYDKEKKIELAEAILAKAMADNNGARLIGGLIVLASFYAYLS